MKDVEIEKCQYCGGRKFIECQVSYCYEGLHQIYVNVANQERCYNLFATICCGCGSVVRTFCKNPKNLQT